MALLQQRSSRNALIRALGVDGFAALAPHLERVDLAGGERLASSDFEIDAVWFPESAVASCVDVLADGGHVELGIVGYEGVVGWPVLLGCTVSPHGVVVQVGGGTVLKVAARDFAAICGRVPGMQALFLRYISAFTVQIGRTAVSNLRDPVERRLSRWLLMFHDRLEGDEIDLTHKAIASMLGIRRASVTDGLHALEGHDLIRNRRGRIVIRDRSRLRKLAGDGYGHAEAHYSRTIAPFGKCVADEAQHRHEYVREPMCLSC